MSDAQILSETAEAASEVALKAVFAAMDERRNFKLEAGAGAGKTYSLTRALNRILDQRTTYLPRSDQRVACLTYTKVARDEIIARTDKNPLVFAETLHGFLWEMIRPYQKSLAASLLELKAWEKHLGDCEDLQQVEIGYDLGIRFFADKKIALHHDDIPVLAIALFEKPKFRSLIADRFPVIFIDEYQDTPKGLAEAILTGHGVGQTSPVVGFFGDHWQQIYDKTCGPIEHPTVTPIAKNANFRSARSIVKFLNRLRPELQQAPAADAAEGSVTVYHTNSWPGERLSGHWKGQISHEATQSCLRWILAESRSRDGIEMSESLKVLMLTHATIANELGYPTLPSVFKRNEAFAHKEDPVIEYFVDIVEPMLEAFENRRYGALFEVLGSRRPLLRSPADKVRWRNFFDELRSCTASGTVGDVLDLLQSESLVALPTRVARRDRELKEAVNSLEPGESLSEPRKVVEYQKLRAVGYAEIRALSAYLAENTVFSTKHAVKGAEFDDVIVLLGRGWTQYDFAKMLSQYSGQASLDERERVSFERSRNLFYVAVSRAKHNLCLLFTQELDSVALATISAMVGGENIVPIGFVDECTPSVG